jgi:hypothetical protein
MSEQYDFVARPPLRSWKPEKKLAIAMCNLSPVARWDTFGGLAETYNYLLGEQGLIHSRQTPRSFTGLISDVQWRDSGELSDWTGPWHRVRDSQGYCRKRSR